jgi:hypothetical protein
MAGRLTATPQNILSPTQCVVAVQATLAALAEFHNCVCLWDIPFWGSFCAMQLQDLRWRGLHNVPITTLLTLFGLPICVVYPVNNSFHLTHHQCVHCARISFLGTLGPRYSSPSSSMAGLQSGYWQSKSSNSNNPHSPHLCFEEGSIWESKLSNSSNPHSPRVDYKLGSNGKAKG